MTLPQLIGVFIVIVAIVIFDYVRIRGQPDRELLGARFVAVRVITYLIYLSIAIGLHLCGRQ